MSNKKYASLNTLQSFLEGLRNIFSSQGHKHTISELTDYTVDIELSATSNNPIANKAVKEAIEAIGTGDLSGAELIAVEDIDEICGTNIQMASEVSF